MVMCALANKGFAQESGCLIFLIQIINDVGLAGLTTWQRVRKLPESITYLLELQKTTILSQILS